MLEFDGSVETRKADLVCEPNVWRALRKVGSLVITISILKQENETMDRFTVRSVSGNFVHIRKVKDVRQRSQKLIVNTHHKLFDLDIFDPMGLENVVKQSLRSISLRSR